ncbi:MAG: helix-turn-helix domain-containing protein [Acidimicrobiales bacterium]
MSNPEAPPTVGELLQRRRKALGLRQEEVAVLAEVGIGTVARVERGEDARMSTIESIADALGTDVLTLLSEAK